MALDRAVEAIFVFRTWAAMLLVGARESGGERQRNTTVESTGDSARSIGGVSGDHIGDDGWGGTEDVQRRRSTERGEEWGRSSSLRDDASGQCNDGEHSE